MTCSDCWWKTGGTSGSPDWEAGLPEVLQPLLRIWFCGHFSAFGMIPSSSTECEAKFKLLTRSNTPLSTSFPCQSGQDSLPQPSQGVCVDEKESRDTSSATGTRLPVVLVNNWTNYTCPPASLDFIQLRDPSNSNQGWDSSSGKQRSFHHILHEEEANKNTDSFSFWSGTRRKKKK